MSFIYYFIQYCFFGFNPYGFFLVTIALHALNSALLFLIFSHFTSLTASWLGALFLAFHSSLWNWIGWTSAQTYFIELFVLLLTLFALHAYLSTKNLGFYFGACALYCANMFLKEQTIFFPLWVMAACYFYPGAKKRCLSISSGFWLVNIGYILTRLHFYPLTKETGTLTFEPTLHSFITRMSSRFFDFVTYTNDMLGLSWLGNGNQLLKGSIIATILSVLALLFLCSKQKKFVVFSVMSMLLFSWPALLMHYQPRYIYLALPWSILIVLVLLLTIRSPVIKRFATLLFTILITFNACFLMHHLSERQEVLHTITTAFKTLVADQRTSNRVIGFLALPHRWFHQGSTQAVWMMRNDQSLPVYQFNAPIIPADGALDDNYLTFTPIKKGWVCTSTNVNKVWFEEPTSKAKSATATITIEEQYLQENLLFVVWDYKHQQFRILDEQTL